MDKALLLIDRGSKEQEVKDELKQLCSLIKSMSNYKQVEYCFLEVSKPYIDEGIRSIAANMLTIMPYFLYPGLKLKASIEQSKKVADSLRLNYRISDCLHYHPNLSRIIINRVEEAKASNNIILNNHEIDLLLIGHGSRDKDARRAFEYVFNTIKDKFRNTYYSFLELDEPNIEQGINYLLNKKPKVLFIMPYFLHKGSHIKYDVMQDISNAIKHADCKVIITNHIGVDKDVAEIVMDKAREAEA